MSTKPLTPEEIAGLIARVERLKDQRSHYCQWCGTQVWEHSNHLCEEIAWDVVNDLASALSQQSERLAQALARAEHAERWAASARDELTARGVPEVSAAGEAMTGAQRVAWLAEQLAQVQAAPPSVQETHEFVPHPKFPENCSWTWWERAGIVACGLPRSAPVHTQPTVQEPSAGRVAELREREELLWHGCLTGDCPHDKQVDCDKALADEVRDMHKRAALTPTAAKP